MKRYKVVFLAGDAVLASREFYTPDDVSSDFKGVAEVVDLVSLMDQRQDLQSQYGCAVSLRVYPIETIPEEAMPNCFRLHWFGWHKRFSSFFHS